MPFFQSSDYDPTPNILMKSGCTLTYKQVRVIKDHLHAKAVPAEPEEQIRSNIFVLTLIEIRMNFYDIRKSHAIYRLISDIKALLHSCQGLRFNDLLHEPTDEKPAVQSPPPLQYFKLA